MTTLKVNGRSHQLSIPADATLGEVLREQLGLHGVRISCAEGECGSCTVLVDGEPVTACLMLAAQAEGAEIVTIEGLASPDDLHPLQQAFIAEQGFQCGVCTPGFILSAAAFLSEHPAPTEEEVARALSGSICRCGSYPFIVKSVMRAAEQLREPAPTAS